MWAGPFVSPTYERVVTVEGTDRLTFLDDTTTQALRDVAPGTATAALVLDANGLPLLHLEILVRPEDVLLVVPDEAAVRAVMTLLAGRTFLADARFTLRDDVVLLVHGEGAAEVVATAGFGVADGGVIEHAGVTIADARDGAVRLLGRSDALVGAASALTAAGAIEGDGDALDAWRVTAGVPTWGREIAAPHLPEELGLLRTHVHLSKGCYPGQEAVARMWMLGRPRRRLARVRVDGPLEPGWTTGSGRSEVRLTAVAPASDAGLAFVPGDAGPGARFGGDDGGVAVLAFPGDGAPPGHDPAVRRRRDRPRGDDRG